MFALALVLAVSQAQAAPDTDWPGYGNGLSGSRYSPAAQITPANVARLQLAWIYRTGDYHRTRGRFEANPILVDGTLFLSTPLGRVVALDPATGVERWSSDQRVDLEGDFGDFASRGVAAWLDTTIARGAPCRLTIFLGTVDARLIALDGASGGRCEAFGVRGVVDLSQGLRNQPAYRGEYGITSPPLAVNGLVIVGGAVADNQRVDAPDGVVRAFDARSGALRWSFDPGANAWSTFTADPDLGLVYVPTGSASPDFFGGARPGQNLYANSVVALRLANGDLAWHFQVVHHDLWDYDVPAQPSLFTWRRGDHRVPAVAVATKMGHLFILDRRDGVPLVPVEERTVPRSDVPGEEAWPTQPFPPPAYRLVPGTLPAEVFGRSDRSRAVCRAATRGLRYEGIFTPQSLRGTINYPGHIGGMNWSGVAVDEARGLVIAPVNNIAMVVTLIPRDSIPTMRARFPGAEISAQRGTPYGMMRTTLWPDGVLPCTPPPWGALAALDLTADSVRWRVPLGETPGAILGRPEGRRYGAIGLGGAIVTRGGLAFIAATLDQQLRAFDVRSGRELWRTPLPAGGQALPTTYVSGGRQYVVIAAGGHDAMRTRLGDYVLAYALPDRRASVPDTSITIQPGAYEGELRVGGARVGLAVTFMIADTLVAGAVGTDSIRVAGAVTFTRLGRSVILDVPFEYPGKGCAGTIRATLSAWNGGALLEGDADITGTCGGGGAPERGSLALRTRRPDNP